MRGTNYQYALIALGSLSTLLLGAFFYREIFPEYKIYQEKYIALEKFRSEYTHEPPPVFHIGIKQILLERPDKGNPTIDRCISCHVALEFPHFSPTKVAYNEQGQLILDNQGFPKQVPNENFVWKKLDEQIATLESENKQAEAEQLKTLKIAHVGEHEFDVTKVLAMHPLIGKETRPFEFHPIEEYGCTSCHNGNGRGLTTLNAHGPVFDGQYEKEFVGHTPHFTEIDIDNDPRFSRVFNGKPGESLLFQTTPIFVGGLIQAKCMQCHQSSLQKLEGLSHVLKKMDQSFQSPVSTEKTVQAMTTDIDLLTKNYQRGERLFISQSCYACHRIAGFSRGGVGPELTQAGNGYPWFIKESIVWPQADVHNSTMPNFVFDHEELEDLVTYLLGQTGSSNAVSATDRKAALQAWEGGQKQSIEKPITPVQMDDLNFAMTTFATEGCAACHRLKGFETNVGFQIEKENPKPAFEALQDEKDWFYRLLPEEIAGSALANVIENNSQEIDKRIVDNVRQDSLLEKIEQTHPKLIESFYTPFKFARRSKNAHYRSLISAEKDPAKKVQLANEWKAWKQRVNRLMFLYAQEYGLGRLIGPRPNWSGVYHSDEWLMEHFKNPALHVPRSIMPVFPFDETKFYALTKMLDKLGVRNSKNNRTLWEQQGFNPAAAYELYCAQCHGDFMQGNGPVASWIYPLPKNLRNGEFLRNLTRERAIESITHGVKGTPMPPWGEVARDKMAANPAPVLTKNEIEALVDWLFSSLPGSTVIKTSEDVPKWHYSPEDAFRDIGRHKLAKKETDLFDTKHNLLSIADPESYFIKKEYYTKENIEQGREFFELNCAVCHGKEADGSGVRSGTMAEAKPRMLTNFDWIQTRDDLRLLRSIKYGVPGTSMTPWGDLTSGLQRLQLVMFIRTLSNERGLREALAESIYKSFDQSDIVLEEARIKNYAALTETQKQYELIKQEREKLYQIDGETSVDSKDLLSLHQKELELLQKLKIQKEKDKRFLSLKTLIKNEKDLYQSRGYELIQTGVEDIFHRYLQMVNLLANRFEYNDDKISINFSEEKAASLQKYQEALLESVTKEIQQVTDEKETDENKEERQARLKALSRLKKNLQTSFNEATRIRGEERKLLGN